jgi:hypothetical protein
VPAAGDHQAATIDASVDMPDPAAGCSLDTMTTTKDPPTR